jgi:PAS domain S-box-containing protein
MAGTGINFSRLTWKFSPDADASWFDAVHPDDREWTLAVLREAVRLELPFAAEFRLRIQDGRYRLFSAHGVPLREPDGAVHHWTGSLIDITDRKPKSGAPRTRAAAEHDAFKHTNSGIAVLDMSGRWLHANPRLCEILGYSEPELTQLTFQEITHPQDQSLGLQMLSAALIGELPSGPIRKRYLRKDGTAVWAKVTMSFVPEAPGREALEVAVIEDIGEQVQAEQKAAFFADLQKRFSSARTSQELAGMAALALGERLGTASCVVEEIGGGGAAVRFCWGKPVTQAVSHLLSDRLRDATVVANTSSDARTSGQSPQFERLGVQAIAAIPFIDNNGQWTATLAVCHDAPRNWTDLEVESIRDVADRLWPPFENLSLLERTLAEQVRFRDAFSSAATGMAVCSLDGCFVEVNNAFCGITGYSPEDLAGASVPTITHPDDRAHSIELMRNVVRERKPRICEKRYIRKDGSEVWVRNSVSALRNSRGEIDNLVAIIEDITGRKRAEQERDVLFAAERLRNEQMRELAKAGVALNAAESAEAALDILTAQARMLTGAHRCVSSLSAAGGKPAIDRVSVSEEDSARSAPLPGGLATTLKRRDGRHLGDIQLSGKHEGSFTGADESMLLQLAEMASAAIENRELVGSLRELSHSFDLAQALVRGLEGRIHYWSHGAQQLYGWSSAEALGRVSHDLLATEFPISIADINAALLDAGHWQGELRHRRKDGTRIVVASYWALHRDSLGEPQAVTEVSTDLSEQKRIEAALQGSNDSLEQFAYVASHDLQEPLRTITSFTQLLIRRMGDRMDDDTRDMMSMVAEGGQRMSGMVQGLLEFSRVGHMPHRVPVACDDVLREALTNLDSAILDSGMKVISAPLPVVQGSPDLLVRVFQNLISNAIRYRSHLPPRLNIDVHEAGGLYVFSVQDNGIGIHPKYKERIFGIFKRLHARSDYEGTGIGLSIVKRIVESHGGRVWVESLPGQGATFFFTLPAIRAAQS